MKLVKDIEGITTGFYAGPPQFEHDGLPTFEDCRTLIRILAECRWWEATEPKKDADHYWLEAERILFLGLEDGGYRIYVRDKTQPKIEDFYDFYRVALVKPEGVIYFEN